MAVSEKVIARIMWPRRAARLRPGGRPAGSSYAGERSAARPTLLLVDAGRDLHDYSAAAPGEVSSPTSPSSGCPTTRGRCTSRRPSTCSDGDVAAFSVGTSPSDARGEMLAPPWAAAGAASRSTATAAGYHRTPDWVSACRPEWKVDVAQEHSPDNAACEEFLRRLKVEGSSTGRTGAGVSRRAVRRRVRSGSRWYREGRLKAFDEGEAQGVARYDSRPQGGSGLTPGSSGRPHPQMA